MKKRQLCVIITIISILCSACVPALAQGLIKEINIKDFSYALTDKDEKSATEFTAGGKLTATVTIENNSNDAQNYEFFMLVKNNDKKLDVGEAGVAKGRILRGKSVTKSISFTFPENETDFSGYTVQSFILEDLNYMKPMSMKAEFGTTNTELYGFRIDGGDIIHPDSDNKVKYEVPLEYTGVPDIQVISKDLSVTVTYPSVIPEPSETGDDLTFNIAAGILTENYILNILRNNPANTDATLKTVYFAKTGETTKVNVPDLIGEIKEGITSYKVATNSASATVANFKLEAEAKYAKADNVEIIQPSADNNYTATVKVTSNDKSNMLTYTFKLDEYNEKGNYCNFTNAYVSFDENTTVIDPATKKKFALYNNYNSSGKLFNSLAVVNYDLSKVAGDFENVILRLRDGSDNTLKGAKWINVYACNSALTAPEDGARYDTNYNAVSAAKGELIGTGYFDGIITDYPLVAIDSEYIKNKIANDDTNVTFIIEAAQEGEGHYIYSANSGSEYEIRLFID